ncbi:MAG: PhoH family protein [Azospirillaceae bacterium]|nr:PhoH family protein [Azospirillaceae bacterium]
MTALPERRIELRFDDNRLLPLLYGGHDSHLVRIEAQLGVTLISRGNVLVISGSTAAAETAKAALESLWQRLCQGMPVGSAEVDAALRMEATALLPRPGREGPPTPGRAELTVVKTKRRAISPRSPVQAQYMQALQDSELVFGLGPAGTGKTYLAVAQAVVMLTAGQVDRIILSRPAVEAGERLGFLPGDMRDKVDPYLRPLYDALYDMIPAEQVAKRLANGDIEVAPLAFMRGRTLANAFVILDEAQNTTPMQMKMFLTRLGESSRMAITGDITQIDLPAGTRSGLKDALEVLRDVEGVEFVNFTDADVVRHPLVARIVRAYDRRDRDRTLPVASAPPGAGTSASPAGAREIAVPETPAAASSTATIPDATLPRTP